jgi:hypothetical protein
LSAILTAAKNLHPFGSDRNCRFFAALRMTVFKGLSATS